jgi:PAS domain S-box-containing protein
MVKIEDNLEHLSILIIEDNIGDFILVEDYLLEKFKYAHIEHFVDFENTKTFFENNNKNLDLILLDLHLPSLSGIELVKNILKIMGNIPIIILTGYSDIALAEKSIQLGVYDFLIKDELNPNLLQKSIHFALNRKSFISQIENERIKFENLFHLSPQPMLLLNYGDLKILDANYAAIEKYGFKLAEFLNMSFLDLHPTNEETMVTNLIFEKTQDENSKIFTHILKNTNTIHVELYFKEVAVSKEKNNIIVQSNDITQRLKHLQTIVSQNKKLKDIAWTQSHVVRAPLARILGIINLIEEEKGNLENLLFWLEQLKVSSNEMDEIVRKIIEDTRNFDLNIES